MKWLDRYFDNLALRLENRIEEAEERIVQRLAQPKPQELTAGDILERKERKQVPIRIQRKPFREVKALAEKTLDPHFQEMQQRIRNEADKQPRRK